jgi:hypothetical protein
VNPAETVAQPPAPEPTETPQPSLTESETANSTESPTATPIRLKPGGRVRSGNSPQPSDMTTPPPSAPSPRPISPAPPTNPAPTSVAARTPLVREVAATSQLNNEYRPNYAFDGNPATAWVPKGNGTEQSLFVHFKSAAVVRSVSILNGDARDEEKYRASNRIKTLRIVLSDGTNQILTFRDEMKMQRFELKQPVTANWAKFEIVSIFPGKTKRTGIAEIAFNEDAR